MSTDQQSPLVGDDLQLTSLVPQSMETSSSPSTPKTNGNTLTKAERRERLLSLIIIGLISFLTGVDYAIIIPTAWGYVQEYTSRKDAGMAVGAVLSVFVLSGGIAGIVLGYLYDIGVPTKKLIIFGSTFQIIGNVLYFIGISIWLIIISRLIAGVALGLAPPLLAEVAKRAPPEGRTQLIAKILGARQVGLFLGPVFTLLLENLNFILLGITVNVYNAPGLLMALLWFLLLIAAACFYYELPTATPLPTSIATLMRSYSTKEVFLRMWNIFKQPTLIALLITSFIAYFNQTALETILTPFTNYVFGWGTLQVSILFAIAGVEITLVYVLFHFISKKFLDQTILLVAYIIMSVACLVAVITLPFTKPGSTQFLPAFLVFVGLDIFSLPLIVVTTTSLLSQQTNGESQGIGQGIQRAIVNIAAIIGPLYGGALLTHVWYMIISLFVIVVIATVLIGVFYRKFRSKATKDELTSLIPPVTPDNKDQLTSLVPPVAPDNKEN